MDVQDVTAQARDAITVKRVYGKPYETNGVTVIPAARVSGAGGGGGGEGRQGEGSGSGSGFGLGARPVGAYVIRGDDVRWEPAIDVVQILGIGFPMLLGVRSIVKILADGRSST
jgi:uncharacterized spore protein YtfJ